MIRGLLLALRAGLIVLATIHASIVLGQSAPPTARGMTYASLAQLPDWSGWWTLNYPLNAELAREPPPMQPAILERIRAARKDDLDPDARRFCRPPQFTGFSGGFVDGVEFLLTPGRITITNESGLIRRIYTDGRALPKTVEATNGGTSVGHWEGETLVIDTIGINPDARYPDRGPGTPVLGRNARITERITRTGPATLEFDVTTVAPEVLTRPDHRKRTYALAQGKTTPREVSFCVDFDRAMDPQTGRQRFDMTPPADLPPPPSQ